MKKNVNTFQYSFPLRLLYRYGNIPATVLLFLYLLPMLFDFRGLKIVYSIILIVFLYYINKYFFYLYKAMPRCIEVRETGLQCSGYFLSREKKFIPFDEITDITGGIFDRRFTKLIAVHHPRGKIVFFSTIRNARLLQDALLRGIRPGLYDAILERIGVRQ